MTWKRDGLCVGQPIEIWFPPTSSTPEEREHLNHQAITICAGCPVQDPCKQAGADEAAGTWGGVPEEQRND